MAFARDRLYKGYLLRNMPTIVSTVKVREIVVHLPCLTSHDRETIEAKREVCGNYDSMVLLLDCLKRRENWPEQFIAALEACDHQTLAAEIRAEYNGLRGISNSNPSTPPTTVTQAHVHPPPSASQLPVPENGTNSPAAVAPPAAASAPPAAPASPPLETPVQPQAPQSSAAQVPEAVSPPEPPQSAPAPAAAPAPSTPPPSPDTSHAQATTTPPPQGEIHPHQEPVENSESDLQICGDNGVTPDQASAGNGEVSIDSVAAPHPSGPVEQCETETPPCPDPRRTKRRLMRSLSPSRANFKVTDGSSLHMETPVKSPVQDTAPPVDLNPAVVQQPEETCESPATQVVVSRPQTEATGTTSPLPGAAGMDASVFDESTLCLSKPGQLISVQPQNHSDPTIPAAMPQTEPYSGNSERLEISDAAPDTVTSSHVPACSAVSSTTVNTNSALPCQENCFTLNHNEPEENQYDSPCQSLQAEEVRVNVIQISEEPSVPNLDGQSGATQQAQIVNGEAAKEMTSAPPLPTNAADSVSSVNASSMESCYPPEPAPADISPELNTPQVSEEKTSSRALSANTKYILTAAGVGACALVMAWKFKN